VTFFASLSAGAVRRASLCCSVHSSWTQGRPCEVELTGMEVEGLSLAEQNMQEQKKKKIANVRFQSLLSCLSQLHTHAVCIASCFLGPPPAVRTHDLTGVKKALISLKVAAFKEAFCGFVSRWRHPADAIDSATPKPFRLLCSCCLDPCSLETTAAFSKSKWCKRRSRMVVFQ
jgi:hypothetical protein